ncbi:MULTISPECIES: NERD domain-containing protein [unclassified Coleofasciculus]|uniref:NERD domain-containing protein n=1 Tax=unclassified Coleofasciculus TaxID=2692782 RepID=UPI001D1424A1|nr:MULTISPECIES: nuclease-related domain-containing DEAD/DEAH box helicase [unclassified Coleofasciculus]
MMIPDSIPTTASEGEKTLYGVLRDRLPDDFLVWHEPRVSDRYPDFIILGSTFGLLIVEVKGWYPRQIITANNNFFEIRRKQGHTSRIERQKSPLRQGHDYLTAVLDKLKSYPILTQHDGNYKGKLAFPVGVGAVMSNITEAQARCKDKDKDIYSLLEKPQVAYQDEMRAWMKWGERELISRFQAMFTIRFSFPALSDEQIRTIKGVLHPEMKIKEVPATSKSAPSGIKLPSGSSVIVGLDIEQERMARQIKDGHHIFAGVAGSGKTLILLARARALANRLLEHRILILCFNIPLASYLRSVLHGDDQNPQYRERIEVRHFHNWARSLMGRLPNLQEFNNNDEQYNQFLGEQVLSILQQQPPDWKWDSVLVDEAHTFSPNWFRCCVAALKDPIKGDLMIVSDGSQSLYKRQSFKWKSVGIQAQGRTKYLTLNYRNTQEILTAAWNIVKPISKGETSVDDDITFPIVKPSAALRHGSKPVLHRVSSKVMAVEALVKQVQQLSESGYAPGDIAIIYRWKARSDRTLLKGMIKQLNDLGLRTYWITESDKTKLNYSVKIPGVRIVTALSSLGLEFKVVLILWVEQFADCCFPDQEKSALARRQLYVAMTRAVDELHLFGSGSMAILDELELTGAAI